MGEVKYKGGSLEVMRENAHQERGLVEMDEQEKEYIAQVHKKEEEWNGEMNLMHLHYVEELLGTKMRMDNTYTEMQHNIKLPVPKENYLHKL